MWMSTRSARLGLTQQTRVVKVFALHFPDPRGKQPDPFDRHSSPRDKQQNAENRANVRKQNSSPLHGKNARRGRPAHLRSPDDSPLRDGNRDRAARTLLVYLQETNPTVYHWMYNYIKENPIPLQGRWDEVSGEAFLRKMLSMEPETAKMGSAEEQLFDRMASIGVDPRQMAQRIMEIRVQLSKEFIQDLGLISDENSVLLRETLQASLANSLGQEPVRNLPPRDTSKVFIHPELLTQGGKLHPEVAQSHPELLPIVKVKAEQGTLPSVPTASTATPASTTPASNNGNGNGNAAVATTNGTAGGSTGSTNGSSEVTSNPAVVASKDSVNGNGNGVVASVEPTKVVTEPAAVTEKATVGKDIKTVAAVPDANGNGDSPNSNGKTASSPAAKTVASTVEKKETPAEPVPVVVQVVAGKADSQEVKQAGNSPTTADNKSSTPSDPSNN